MPCEIGTQNKKETAKMTKEEKTKEIQQMKDAIVEKALPLADMDRSKYSVTAIKLYDTYLSTLDPSNPEDTERVFPRRYLQALYGVTEIRKDKLNKDLNVFFLPVPIPDDEDPNGFEMIPQMEKAKYQRGDVILKAKKEAVKYMIDKRILGKLRYRLSNVAKLTSNHAYEMYMLLEKCKYQNIAEFEIGIRELEKKITYTNSKTYQEYKHFNNLVLKKVKAMLDEYSTLSFEYYVIDTTKGNERYKIVLIEKEPNSSTIDEILNLENLGSLNNDNSNDETEEDNEAEIDNDTETFTDGAEAKEDNNEYPWEQTYMRGADRHGHHYASALTDEFASCCNYEFDNEKITNEILSLVFTATSFTGELDAEAIAVRKDIITKAYSRMDEKCKNKTRNGNDTRLHYLVKALKTACEQYIGLVNAKEAKPNVNITIHKPYNAFTDYGYKKMTKEESDELVDKQVKKTREEVDAEKKKEYAETYEWFDEDLRKTEIEVFKYLLGQTEPIKMTHVIFRNPDVKVKEWAKKHISQQDGLKFGEDAYKYNAEKMREKINELQAILGIEITPMEMEVKTKNRTKLEDTFAELYVQAYKKHAETLKK